jgi:hypothetical protein
LDSTLQRAFAGGKPRKRSIPKAQSATVSSIDDLIASLPEKVIIPAEAKAKELQGIRDSRIADRKI